MEKKRAPIFLKVFLVAVVVMMINLGGIMFIYGGFSKGIIGLSIQDVPQIYGRMPFSSKMLLIGQGVFVFGVLLFAVLRDLSLRIGNFSFGQANVERKDYETDLDLFYSLLKKKKKIPLAEAAKFFNLKEEVVLGWAKMLEANNLAEVEYLNMGRAEVKLIEKA